MRSIETQSEHHFFGPHKFYNLLQCTSQRKISQTDHCLVWFPDNNLFFSPCYLCLCASLDPDFLSQVARCFFIVGTAPYMRENDDQGDCFEHCKGRNRIVQWVLKLIKAIKLIKSTQNNNNQSTMDIEHAAVWSPILQHLWDGWKAVNNSPFECLSNSQKTLNPKNNRQQSTSHYVIKRKSRQNLIES